MFWIFYKGLGELSSKRSINESFSGFLRHAGSLHKLFRLQILQKLKIMHWTFNNYGIKTPIIVILP